MRRISVSLLLICLPFFSACRCLPCLSAVPYHVVLEKSDERAPGNDPAIGKVADRPAAARGSIAAQAAHEAHTGGVKMAADNKGNQPLE
jgi:hypothetical protein